MSEMFVEKIGLLRHYASKRFCDDPEAYSAITEFADSIGSDCRFYIGRLNSIVEKVAEMRNAQRKYFKTRSPDWLNRSKCLERDVDKMIQVLKDPQGDLFQK